MESADSNVSHRITLSQLAILFLLGLLPRIAGLLPHENGDENWSASVRILTGEFSGGTSQTLPLVNYLNAASFVVLYAIGRLIGVWHGTADFRAQYFIDPTPFVFSGRLVAASLGALSAPLSALIANRLGLTRRSSLIVGVMAALLPANVWLSHSAKPDSGIAFAILLLTWSMLRRLDHPGARWSDVLVGVALAVAISFKQTALFIVAPLLVGYVMLLRWEQRIPWTRIARGLLTVFLSSVVAWIPMNIGILIDIREFLSYQSATAILSIRDAPADQIIKHVVPLIAGNVSGLTMAGLAAWLILPLVRRDRKVLSLWLATVFAYVALIAASGGGFFAARYLLPYNALAFALGCVAALSLAERRGASRLAGVVLSCAILGYTAFGLSIVLKQAMTPPISVRCSAVLEAIAKPEQDKILAASLYVVGVPIDATAADDEFRRHERLAKKYGVELPERAAEKVTHEHQTARGSYVRKFPYAMGGMEDLTIEVAERAVKPFWWPIQPEEFKLAYWTDQGFNIFVVLGESQMENSGIPAYESMHREIKEQGELVAVLPSKRQLFKEKEVRIYRIRGGGSPSPHAAPASRG